jgi:glycosyltransferase involved in cell wall biosynthesis
VRWPVNSEAPFEFEAPEGLKIYERYEMSSSELQQLCRSIQPDILLCSGWIDKEYLKICQLFKSKIPRVLLLDNQWKGRWKQRLATIAFIFIRTNYFDKAWVAGDAQFDYACKLGFAENLIAKGFYSADTQRFQEIYRQNVELKAKQFPRRFLYVGRYVEFKGLDELWSAFRIIHKLYPDWELWCIGTGEMWDSRANLEGLRHIGFVQPKEMGEYLKDCGIFVLPSRKEPWGVVVQEMAAAGFPLILSSEVGAASAYLVEEQNGFLFEAGDRESLLRAMELAIKLTDQQRFQMGEISHNKAIAYSPEIWADTLQKLMQ